jgi:hypothetical protein
MAKGNTKDLDGRPTLYKKEYDEQVYKLCLLGATDADIANFFDICEATVNNWKIKHKSFLESIKRGKEIADMDVAQSLHKRATGYEQEIIKVFQYQGEPVVIPVIEKIAPDTGAAMAWLKNRQPRYWRDKQDIEHSGSVDLNTKTTLIDKYLSDEDET